MKSKQPAWKKIAQTILLSRKIDELEEKELTPQGKIKYQFSARGHELAQVLLAEALNHPHDAAMGYYRSRPFVLASGMTATESLASSMALSGLPSDGRDVGVIFSQARRNGPTILPTSGDVGAQFTPIAGWAQAIHYRQNTLKDETWQGAIAVALGGDGSVAANGFWSALNIVTTQNLPMLFFIEDNGYGISVPSTFQTPDGDIAANLASYKNLKIVSADGTNPEKAWQAIDECVTYIRMRNRPALLKMDVVRLQGHTFIDNQAYKPKEILQAEALRDPLIRLQEYLLEKKIVSANIWTEWENDVQTALNAALKEAESTPKPDPNQVKQHLFFDRRRPLVGGLRPEESPKPKGNPQAEKSGARVSLIESVRRTLDAELGLNPRLLVFGEDVGVKGGVHGTTKDLQLQHGETRVFDTSLSEEGILGRSIGLAMAGLMPVPEIQFRKYADPAYDQITNIGWIRWRTAGNFAAPMVVRIPVGFGKKTGDPWHSVSGEAIYAHTLGWRIAYPSNAADAAGLLRSALRGDDPTFFLEHRALLDSPEGRSPYPSEDYTLPFGVAAKLASGNELTLITWGAMVARCAEAIREFTGRISLIDLRTIIPWDRETVLKSVQETGKVLIVHEDTQTAGFGAEIAATIAEEAFIWLDAPVTRLTTPDVPIPYNEEMMNVLIPAVARIRNKVAELLQF
jgi:2-oxoisovalerate dehydrogenase E1 component